MNNRPQVPGDRIGPYVLRRKLGEGAMGTVWFAIDPKSRMEVAVKLLQPEYSRDERMVKRFLREAQSAAKLNHPNTVAVHQAGEARGAVFIIMEWIDGGNLQDILDTKGRMPWPEATQAIREAAAGLMAAHEVGLIHRDVKPSNLMRPSRGATKVVDFGLARPVERRSNITLQGVVIGTPAYMSPEQCTGQDLDARSDLYSLVCTYYHLLAGEAPFGSMDIAEVLYKQRNAPFPDIRKLVPDVPEAIHRILDRGTKKVPAQRFQTAAELITELDAVLATANARTQASPRAVAAGGTVISGADGGTVISANETLASAPAVDLAPGPSSLPPNNLPVSLTSFVGRKKEMAEVKELLAKTRLLSLLGAGGSGKTRLALEVAGELLETHADGTWLVEFAALTDPELVPTRVAMALGLREEPGQPLTDTLVNFLESKSALLVLDNCEHLRAACAALAETLLRSCPNLRFLVSSREALHVKGETVYPVPSLAVPDFKARTSAGTALATALVQFEEVRNCEAVQLFVDRAASSQARFALTDSNALDVAHICKRLDGIPLAIELAAARVKMLTLQQIAARLDDSIKLLTRGTETALPRQQTLRATMDWSYELLAEKERALFQRLAVFAGGFALEAAESVCPGNGLENDDILDLLSELVDKSLVTVAEDEGEQARYRLLETIRQYAREKLGESDQLEATSARHRDFFFQLAERAGAQLTGPAQDLCLRQLEREYDNLRTVLDWTVKRDVNLGLQLSKSLWRFWDTRGYWREGRQWLEQFLAAVQTVKPDLRAAALDAAGNLASNQGDYTQATVLFEEQLALNLRLADQRGVADALHNLAVGVWKHGDFSQARKLSEESLTIRRELADNPACATSLNFLGLLANEQKDYQTAATFYEESLAIRRKLGDKASIASVLMNLANNLAAIPDKRPQARALLEESLAIRRQIGDRAGISQCLTNLALTAQEESDYDQARALLEESLAIVRELGDKKGLAYALRNFGELMQLTGEFLKARALYQQSLAMFRELDDKFGITMCLEGYAMLAGLQKQADRAVRLFAIAAVLREAMGVTEPVSFPVADYDAQLATTRSQLSEAACAAVWAAAREMTTDQAIAYALGNNPPGDSRRDARLFH